MALQVPSQDRILNKYPVTNSMDKTILNADNVMQIFDSLVNGQYALKPAKQYKTYLDLMKEKKKEPGQTAYVLEQGFKDTLFIYNGFEWVTLVGSSANYSIKVIDYPITPNETSIVTDLNLERVTTYIVLLNGLKVSINEDYTVSTTEEISTIILNETNEGKITIIYQ